MELGNRIVLALDGLCPLAASTLTSKVRDRVYAYKIHDLYDRHGATIVETLKRLGAPRIWIDMKLHDIPVTVANRASALKDAGADIITVHASGHDEMMRAAVENGPSEIYAVTVLTSLDDARCTDIYRGIATAAARYMALLALKVGVHGIVCSPREVGDLKRLRDVSRPLADLPANVKLVVPGTRSAGKDRHDQARVETPAKAVQDGADLLVIGRQVTGAEDPIAALEEIENELAATLPEVG